jgi:hypothetical protein
VFLALIKVLPLAIYLRSAACKFQLPVLGCDSPMCPVAGAYTRPLFSST